MGPGDRALSQELENRVHPNHCLCLSALVEFRSWGGAQRKFGGKINSFSASVTLFSCSVPWFNYRNNCHSSSHGAGCIPYMLGFQSGCIWYKTNIFFSFSNSHKLIDNNGYFLGLPFNWYLPLLIPRWLNQEHLKFQLSQAALWKQVSPSKAWQDDSVGKGVCL